MDFIFSKPDLDKLKAFWKRQREKKVKKKGRLILSASSGLYNIQRDEQLSSVVKKVGYAMTRGVKSIDISADNFNEVNLSEGKEVRYIAEKQGLELTMHGSLQVPMCVPDRIQWREAQEHIEGSIISSVYAGSKLVNFHSCLNIWLELIQYAGRRLEVFMCDWFGRPISKICSGNQKMADWIGTLSPEISSLAAAFIWRPTDIVRETWEEETVKNDMAKIIESDPDKAAEFNNIVKKTYTPEFLGNKTIQELANDIYGLDGKGIALKGIVAEVFGAEEFDKEFKRLFFGRWMDEVKKKVLDEKYEWEIDRSEGRMSERDFDLVVRIVAHYLWLMQDPIWKGFMEIPNIGGKGGLLERYEYDFENPTSDVEWLDKSILKAKDISDMDFKLFYYGVVGAKFLWGHILKTFDWMETKLPAHIENELRIFYTEKNGDMTPENEKKFDEELEELMKNIKEVAIGIENPDARDPSQAGKYMLWKPEHIYVSLREVRKSIENDDDWKHIRHFKDMAYHIFDFEQLATQGVDPLIEMKRVNRIFDDMGRWTKMVHSNYPSPLHAHSPIDKGDRESIYRCLWELRKTGLGKEESTYILFERGGGQNPFKGSMASLRSIIAHLEKNVHPDKLPALFYAIAEGTADDYPRQKMMIWEHKFDPLKGTLKVPEETYTMLSSAAVKDGKQPKEWQSEEFQ